MGSYTSKSVGGAIYSNKKSQDQVDGAADTYHTNEKCIYIYKYIYISSVCWKSKYDREL